MKNERIYLTEDKRAFLDAYISDEKGAPREAMLIFPGGGYKSVCTEREGEPIALAYLEFGYNAFVLNYRVGEPTDLYPTQLTDAITALLTVKRNAERFNIRPERVFAVGFSAGGHLAGSLGLAYKNRELLDSLNVSTEDVKLNGVVLSYPVVSALKLSHSISFERLTGLPFDKIPNEIKVKYSLEEQIDENSPPALIWHTARDTTVPPIGSFTLAAKYVELGIPVSFHVYPYGSHGLALATEATSTPGALPEPLAERWLLDSVDFLKTVK